MTDLATQLDLIEAELRRLGLLNDSQEVVPNVKSAFGMNEMPFEQWLAQVFLPRARERLLSNDLPSSSQVGLAAIRNLDGWKEADALIELLCKFDQSIEAAATR